MASHKLSLGQFATTSGIPTDAVIFANANGVNLPEVDALLALIEWRSQEKREALLVVCSGALLTVIKHFPLWRTLLLHR